MEPIVAAKLLLSLVDSEATNQLLELCAVRAMNNEELPKVKNYLAVVNSFDDEQKNFRISRTTYDKLVELFADSVYFPKNILGKPPKSPETHILAFIWYAANKATLRGTSQLFDMALPTLHEVVNRMINFLLDIAPYVIRFPKNDNEKQNLSGEFGNLIRIPGVVGCLDGTYISVRTPAHKTPSDYVNRHHYTSMTLQGICDSKKRFIDCFAGVPSKCHDSKVFSLSFVKPLVNALGNDYHIVADAAYGVSTNVMTPYKNYGNLSQEDRNYNKELSKARVKIKNAFGLLKSRFRHLIRTDFMTVEKTSHFIIACCVLHNLAIDNDGLFLSQAEINEIRDFIDNINNSNRHNRNNANIGAIKRDGIRDNL